MKILFVCSRNKWRSRTAETIFKNNGSHLIKSAGTKKSARIRLNHNMLNWADLTFVMEENHKKEILKNFEFDENQNVLEVLDIEDNYKYMDSELIEILQIKLNHLFNNGQN